MIEWILRFLGIGKPEKSASQIAKASAPKAKAKKNPTPKKAKKK